MLDARLWVRWTMDLVDFSVERLCLELTRKTSCELRLARHALKCRALETTSKNIVRLLVSTWCCCHDEEVSLKFGSSSDIAIALQSILAVVLLLFPATISSHPILHDALYELEIILFILKLAYSLL